MSLRRLRCGPGLEEEEQDAVAAADDDEGVAAAAAIAWQEGARGACGHAEAAPGFVRRGA